MSKEEAKAKIYNELDKRTLQWLTDGELDELIEDEITEE